MHSRTEVIGRLGKDPVIRYMPDGKAVCDLSVAATYTYTDNAGARQQETTWYKVTVYGNCAINCSKYLRKGSTIRTEGRLSPDRETGSPKIWFRKDGTAAAAYELTTNNVLFLDKKPLSQAEGEDYTDSEEEGIPF